MHFIETRSNGNEHRTLANTQRHTVLKRYEKYLHRPIKVCIFAMWEGGRCG